MAPIKVQNRTAHTSCVRPNLIMDFHYLFGITWRLCHQYNWDLNQWWKRRRLITRSRNVSEALDRRLDVPITLQFGRSLDSKAAETPAYCQGDINTLRRDKMATFFSRRHFQMHFLQWKCIDFLIKISLTFVPKAPITIFQHWFR